MNSPYHFSIALCTYNGEAYLNDQLDSILNQSRLPDELVVCDDGSSDHTVEIVRNFASTAPFCVSLNINQQRLGVSKNFEKAITLCKGEIIALADQDDVWYQHKIEILEDQFQKFPNIDLLFSDACIVDARLNPLGYSLWEEQNFSSLEKIKFRKGNSFDVLLKHNVVTGATMAFKAVSRQWFLPIQETWLHDAWIAFVISMIGEISMIEKPLIDYRQHSSNQIGAMKKSIFYKMKTASRTSLTQYQREWNQLSEVRNRIQNELVDRCSIEIIQKLDKKMLHLYERGHLPNNLFYRFIFASRELMSLNYHRYSKGFSSYAADILLHE